VGHGATLKQLAATASLLKDYEKAATPWSKQQKHRRPETRPAFEQVNFEAVYHQPLVDCHMLRPPGSPYWKATSLPRWFLMADPASAGGKPTAKSFASLPNENNAMWGKKILCYKTYIYIIYIIWLYKIYMSILLWTELPWREPLIQNRQKLFWMDHGPWLHLEPPGGRVVEQMDLLGLP